MIYQIVIEKHAAKQLGKIKDPDYTRIKNTILDLAKNPRPEGAKKLKGRLGYRIRQGDYRIIYDIEDNILTVFILTAGHRKDVYE
ncbi:MAG: type II toxin-antitoxin system RelE/ParE family toxin [Bacteroidetes bacterium]|nr:type II toxin-antitoxin system RelE/ParE family toxin [Bacteroidota bacterium]